MGKQVTTLGAGRTSGAFGLAVIMLGLSAAPLYVTPTPDQTADKSQPVHACCRTSPSCVASPTGRTCCDTDDDENLNLAVVRPCTSEDGLPATTQLDFRGALLDPEYASLQRLGGVAHGDRASIILDGIDSVDDKIPLP